MKLTAKQEKFCRNIVDGMTQKDAYVDAYDTENMAKETIYRKATEEFQKGKITARIEELRKPALTILAKAQADMAQTIVDTLKATGPFDTPDHSNRLKAAKTGLDYLGYEAPQKMEHTVKSLLGPEDVEDMLKELNK